jgi:hypothetical protein
MTADPVALRAIMPTQHATTPLHRANDLITSRTGYGYEAIRQAVERRLAKRSP